jgi:hypothetical protein
MTLLRVAWENRSGDDRNKVEGGNRKRYQIRRVQNEVDGRREKVMKKRKREKKEVFVRGANKPEGGPLRRKQQQSSWRRKPKERLKELQVNRKHERLLTSKSGESECKTILW